MKSLVILLLVIVSVVYCNPADECPPGRYKPDNELCNGKEHREPEPQCPRPVAHGRPDFNCNCWCNPGTVRNVKHDTCVRLEDCHDAWN